MGGGGRERMREEQVSTVYAEMRKKILSIFQFVTCILTKLYLSVGVS